MSGFMSGVSSYKEVLSQELAPVFHNQVNLRSSRSIRVDNIVILFLRKLQEARLPLSGAYLLGSRLTDLFATRLEFINDIDFKIILEGGQGESAGLRFCTWKVLCVTLNELLSVDSSEEERSLQDLGVVCFKPVTKGTYSFQGCTLMGVEGHLPFEISVIVTRNVADIPSVMNIDSLFIPINRFDSTLGTIAPHQFHLYSSQGPILAVIDKIRNRILDVQNLKFIIKYGWARYVLAITDGFSCLDPRISDYCSQSEERAPRGFVYETNQFVQKKRREVQSIYWNFFSCNALFSYTIKNENYNELVSNFFDLVQRKRQSSIWMSFLQQIVPSSFNPHHLPALLQLLIPLFASEVIVKMHLQEPWLQCKMNNEERGLYILLPLPRKLSEEELCSILALFKQTSFSLTMSYRKEAIVGVDLPFALFWGIYSIKTPFSQSVIEGWVFLYPSLFPLLLEKGVRFTGERFSLLKAQLLLKEIMKEDFSLLTLQEALSGCDLSLLSWEEKALFTLHFMQKKELVMRSLLNLPVECFSLEGDPSSLVLKALPLCDNANKPKVACSAIKAILNTYQLKMFSLPLITWKKLALIVETVKGYVINPTPWNQLLRHFTSHVFTLHRKEKSSSFPPLALSQFVAEVSLLTDFSFQENLSWEEQLLLFTLLEKGNISAAIEHLVFVLQNTSDESSREVVKKHFREFPPSVYEVFDKLVARKAIEQSLLFFKLQQGLISDEERITAFCLALKRGEYTCTKAIEAALLEECGSVEIVWTIYLHFYDVESIATHLENRYFFGEEFKQLTKNRVRQKDPSVCRYAEILFQRMEKNYRLASCLEDLEVDAEQIRGGLVALFNKRIIQPEAAYQLVCFIGENFVDFLEERFLESFSSRESIHYAHLLMTKFVTRFPLELKKKYGSIFIEEFENLLKRNPIETVNQAKVYLSDMTEEELFILAQKCYLFSAGDLFPTITSLLKEDFFKKRWNINVWTPALLQAWVNSLAKHGLLTEEYERLFILYAVGKWKQILQENDERAGSEYFSLLGHGHFLSLFFQASQSYGVLVKSASFALHRAPSLEVLTKAIGVLAVPFKAEPDSSQEGSKVILAFSCLQAISRGAIEVDKLPFNHILLLIESLYNHPDIDLFGVDNWEGIDNCLARLSTISEKNKEFSRAESVLQKLAQNMMKLTVEVITSQPVIAKISSKIIAFLVRSGELQYVQTAQNLLEAIHRRRLGLQGLDCSIEARTYCLFLEKTAKDSRIASRELGVLSVLADTIKTHKKVKELTDCILNTIFVLCEEEGVDPERAFVTGSLGLELLGINRYKLPIPDRFKSRERVSKLVEFVFANSPEGIPYFSFFKSCWGVFNKHKLEEKIIVRILEKGLRIAKSMDKTEGFRGPDAVSSLLLVSYAVCPDYVPFVTPCKKIRKEFVAEVLACFLAFENINAVDMALSGFLNNLMNTSLLKEEFFYDLVVKIAEIRGLSIADSYSNMFMNRLFKGPILWNSVLVILKKIDVSIWEEEEVDRFSVVFALAMDTQYVFHSVDKEGSTCLLPILECYLRLMKRASKVYLPHNLLADIVINPDFYFSEQQKTQVLEVLKQVATRVFEVSYAEADLGSHKVDKFVALCHSFYGELTPDQKADFAPFLLRIGIEVL